MKTALKDTFAFVRRREANGPNHGTFSPATLNVRPREVFSVGRSPDQIRQGDTPARPSKQQIYTALAIAPYKAVMRDDFWISILNVPNNVATLHGRVGFYGERQNIDKPQSDAYGSLVPLLSPADPYTPFG